MPADLDIITKTYDLIMWTVDHTMRFPRRHRYSLGTRIEERLYELLDFLVEAKYSRNKTEVLRRAALRVEQLRYQFRLTKDFRILSFKSHRHGISLLDNIGRQLGGWRKSVA